MPNFISEDDIEAALVKRLVAAGFDELNCFTKQKETLPDGSGRADKRDVVFPKQLYAALQQLNPDLPEAALIQARDHLMQSRQVMAPVAANLEIYDLLRDGVTVAYTNADGRTVPATVRVVDWDNPQHNNLLAVRQLWIAPTGQGRR